MFSINKPLTNITIIMIKQKSKKTSDDDLYTVPDNVASKDKVEPRRSERLQIKQLTN